MCCCAQARVAQLLDTEVDVDFVDINMGCPIDVICNRGMGAGLAGRFNKVQENIYIYMCVCVCLALLSLATSSYCVIDF